MSNAITNFGQFRLALTGLANHERIGVVPTIRKGMPAFGSIGDQLPMVPSIVRDRHVGEHHEIFDVEAFARAHDDGVLIKAGLGQEGLHKEVIYLDRVLSTRMGDLLPDERFFGREITEEQAQRRDRIKLQLTQGEVDPVEDAKLDHDTSTFADMTVEALARRLASMTYLQGGGHKLADAVLTRGYVLRADGIFDPEHLISAGALLAHINTPWSLQLAESAFVAAAAELVQCDGCRDILAAAMYGFAADMRDARAGGFEKDNPMRATAARAWLKATENPEREVDIGARVFFGMSEAYRAGDMDTYVQLASAYAGTLLGRPKFYEGLQEVARYVVRASWALAEQVERGEVLDDGTFWGGMVEDMGLAGDYFSKKGDEELAEIASQLYHAAVEMRP